MLQSPTSLFPDPSFRLQALVHGRTYLSPVHHAPPTAAAPSLQSPPGSGGIDPAAHYRAGGGGIMYQSHHHRLPHHFSLALPPSDILPPQYQPHVAAFCSSTQSGFHHHPGLMSSAVRRATFQGPLQPPPTQPPTQPPPIESYSQTLFNLSHQTHHHHHLPHQAALPHSVGPLSLQQSSVRPSLRAGPASSSTGGQAEEAAAIQDRAAESFSLRAMPNYFEAACDGRLPGGRVPVRELPLRPVGVSSQRVRHQPSSQAKHLIVAEEDATASLHSYQSQHLPHHHLNHHHLQQQHLLPPRLSRISTSTATNGRNTTPTHNNNNNNNNNDDDDDCNDKDATTKLLLPARSGTSPHSWKSPTLTSDDVSELDFSFKDPNAVGVHHPSDRPPLRSNPIRSYGGSSNPGVGPSSSSMGGRIGSPSGSSSPSSLSVHQKETGLSSSSSSSYHRHFLRGSVIQLAGGQLKRVEDLRTEDFLDSCGVSADLSVDMSRVTHVRMNHDTGGVIIGFAVGKKQIQVTVEAIVDHPFFVFNRGWSSCSPSRTLDRYGLPCHPLTVGDICISLTHRYPNSPAPSKSPTVSQSLDLKGAEKRGSSVSSLLQGCPLLATVDPCPPATSTGSKSPPPPSEETDHRTGQEVTASTNGHSSVSRKRRWSAPDDAAAGRESSPPSGFTPPNASRVPFKVTLTSVPSVAL